MQSRKINPPAGQEVDDIHTAGHGVVTVLRKGDGWDHIDSPKYASLRAIQPLEESNEKVQVVSGLCIFPGGDGIDL